MLLASCLLSCSPGRAPRHTACFTPWLPLAATVCDACFPSDLQPRHPSRLAAPSIKAAPRACHPGRTAPVARKIWVLPPCIHPHRAPSGGPFWFAIPPRIVFSSCAICMPPPPPPTHPPHAHVPPLPCISRPASTAAIPPGPCFLAVLAHFAPPGCGASLVARRHPPLPSAVMYSEAAAGNNTGEPEAPVRLAVQAAG